MPLSSRLKSSTNTSITTTASMRHIPPIDNDDCPRAAPTQIMNGRMDT